MKDFGNRLTEARKRTGKSRKEVAEHFGIPYSTLSSWENGQAEPKRDNLTILANYYNCSVDELLGIEKDPTPEDDEPLIEYEVLYDFLVRSGIIEEGEQLSKADARFVAAIVDLLVEWSNLRKA